MSSGVNWPIFQGTEGNESKVCSIVSLYEDLGGRELLLRTCDSLKRTFRDDMEFTTGWWRFKYLADPEIQEDAGRAAVGADLILVAPASSELPSYVRKWFETWLPGRVEGDGVMVVVQPEARGFAPGTMPTMSYLRNTAQRAHLDYLPLDRFAREGLGRFSVLQSGLEERVFERDLPLHWGINE